MKFYMADGRYYATKAEVKGKDFHAVELATDQASLISTFNHLLDERDAAQADAPEPTQPVQKMHELLDTVREQQRGDITIEEAIAEADYPRALTLAHHIHHRLMEHARAVGEKA